MKDDKKKLAIVGVLGFIIVGVGAFQFMKGGSTAPVKPASTAKPAAAPEKKDDGKIKNPEYSAPLADRDPFKAPADGVPPDLNAKLKLASSKSAPKPPSMGGHLGTADILPSSGAGGTIAPLSVAPAEPIFGYRLLGLISGRHPAAVFTDASGAQRLVPLNGSLDGDTQLLAVQKGRVVVSFRGKHLRLSLGGTPDAN